MVQKTEDPVEIVEHDIKSKTESMSLNDDKSNR